MKRKSSKCALCKRDFVFDLDTDGVFLCKCGNFFVIVWRNYVTWDTF